MTWHSTGKTTNMQNADWDKLAYNMSASKHENRRCVYENEDIMKTHQIATFSNGSRDAILASYLKKDGLSGGKKQVQLHCLNLKNNSKRTTHRKVTIPPVVKL